MSKSDLKSALEIWDFANEVVGGVVRNWDVWPEGLVLYALVENGRVSGCIVVEPLKYAYTTTQPIARRNVVCGITLVWVGESVRRRGVGRRLFEAVIDTFVFGFKITGDLIAFSQPTEMGKKFASGCVGEGYLVYEG